MLTIIENADLAPHTTFGVKAKASQLVEIHSIDDLREIYQQNHPVLFLGGGSNILLMKDWPGVVAINRMKGIDVLLQENGDALIKASGGENWHELVMWCTENGYFGIENMALIPGTVGAAPIQNIGAYGMELKDVFHELEAWNIDADQVELFDCIRCQFGYRDSYFKREGKGKYIILSVTMRLDKDPKVKLDYGDIRKTIDELFPDTSERNPLQVAQAVIHIRSSKLPNPAEIGNAGSFFKNPIVSEQVYQKAKINYPDMPHYSTGEGLVKIPAGWLIEKAGWKGFRKGDAGVHTKQALVLVNYGSAKGVEIWAVSEEVIKSVAEKFGILLEREVNVV